MQWGEVLTFVYSLSVMNVLEAQGNDCRQSPPACLRSLASGFAPPGVHMGDLPALVKRIVTGLPETIFLLANSTCRCSESSSCAALSCYVQSPLCSLRQGQCELPMRATLPDIPPCSCRQSIMGPLAIWSGLTLTTPQTQQVRLMVAAYQAL